ncbi:MAG: hypothetical protein WBC05_15105, partial [Sedimentisphaerales bacterium]
MPPIVVSVAYKPGQFENFSRNSFPPIRHNITSIVSTNDIKPKSEKTRIITRIWILLSISASIFGIISSSILLTMVSGILANLSKGILVQRETDIVHLRLIEYLAFGKEVFLGIREFWLTISRKCAG